MDVSRVHKVREEMERADARRLQPHYIESFFLEAFSRLGGRASQRESRRYEVTHVPATVRSRDRQIGVGEPVLQRYERIVFDGTHHRLARLPDMWERTLTLSSLGKSFSVNVPIKAGFMTRNPYAVDVPPEFLGKMITFSINPARLS